VNAKVIVEDIDGSGPYRLIARPIGTSSRIGSAIELTIERKGMVTERVMVGRGEWSQLVKAVS
jgi:hypothetical protein